MARCACEPEERVAMLSARERWPEDFKAEFGDAEITTRVHFGNCQMHNEVIRRRWLRRLS